MGVPPEKAGGGGKYTMGKPGDQSGGAFFDTKDPNFDPDERRIDPEDGVAYKFKELAEFYKGKFNKQTIAEYWEYECTAIQRKGKKKSEPETTVVVKGPSLAASVAAAKPKARGQRRRREARSVVVGRPAIRPSSLAQITLASDYHCDRASSSVESRALSPS